MVSLSARAAASSRSSFPAVPALDPAINNSSIALIVGAWLAFQKSFLVLGSPMALPSDGMCKKYRVDVSILAA